MHLTIFFSIKLSKQVNEAELMGNWNLGERKKWGRGEFQLRWLCPFVMVIWPSDTFHLLSSTACSSCCNSVALIRVMDVLDTHDTIRAIPPHLLFDQSSDADQVSCFTGLRLRRQQWCLIITLLIVVLIVLGLSLSGLNRDHASLLNSPELQQAAIQQLLREVPLIDG